MNFSPARDSRVLLPLNLRESVGKLAEREKAKVRVGAGIVKNPCFAAAGLAEGLRIPFGRTTRHISWCNCS